MVDFRYHLVSLIAVFMALAVGIILGAGPLQNSIGSALTDQVDSLRESRDEARADAERADRQSESYREGIESLTPDLIDGVLPEQGIVLVTLPGTDDDAVDLHRDNLEAAGAHVTGVISLTDAFFSAERSSYRNALAGQLSSYVETAESPMGTLVRGLELIVTSEPGEQAAATLTELYQASDQALIEVTDALNGSADAILVIGPSEEEIPEEVDDAYETARANTLSFLAAVEVPMVVTAGPGEGTLLEAIRGGDGSVSTVDSPLDPTALLNVPYALTQELAGGTVTWGLADSSELVVGKPVPVELALEPGATEGEGTVGEPLNENPVEPTEAAS